MHDTLCLFDGLLTRGRRLLRAGQAHDAAACFERLLALAGVPALVAAEANQLLGEIALKRRLYRRARRHLVAAVRLVPEGPRGHFLLGLACAHDDRAGPRRAARHFRRALRQAPRLARCRGELGLALVSLGEVEEGVAELRRAVADAPQDAAAAGRLVKGLLRAGKFADALAEARAARFRAPRCPRIAKLCSDLQLAALRRDRETDAADEPAAAVLLPFLRPVGQAAAATRHAAHAPAGPHLVRLRRGRPARRRAP